MSFHPLSCTFHFPSLTSLYISGGARHCRNCAGPPGRCRCRRVTTFTFTLTATARSTMLLLQSTILQRIWPKSRPGWEQVGLEFTRSKPRLYGSWLGSSQPLAQFDVTHVHVLSSCLRVQDTARDLGVVIDTFDSQLSLSTHDAEVCRSCYMYYQPRQLRQAVRSLSEDASKTLVQAFVSCRLDYCNSVFFGISEGLMNRLQSAQNAATRLVTDTRRSDHITPLHRCSISYAGYGYERQCVDMKAATLVRGSSVTV